MKNAINLAAKIIGLPFRLVMVGLLYFVAVIMYGVDKGVGEVKQITETEIQIWPKYK